jgi:hypothetical protein
MLSRSAFLALYKHLCPDWDFLEIDDECEEFNACTCKIDSDGQTAKFTAGTKVRVGPNGMVATVVKQWLHYDGPESFWGNVLVEYDDGIRGTCNSWQLKYVENT